MDEGVRVSDGPTGDAAADERSAPGGRRPRLEDVAAHVGLSPASVSMALRGAPGPSKATRQRVLQAAAELGYRPDRTASLLARHRRHLLGVLLDITNTFHTELVVAMDAAAARVGYDIVLSTLTTRGERRATETLVDYRAEALLLVGPEASVAALEALEAQVPVVVVGRRIPGGSVDVVRTADDAGTGLGVDHLVALGHREIAYVDGGRGTIAADRRRGYREAMRRHGLSDHLRIVAGGTTEVAGARAAAALAADLPTAVVTYSDRVALGLLEAWHASGPAVPAEVSVVGYDDSPAAQLPQVALTSVRQDAGEQAARAVAAAVERLDGGRRAHRDEVLAPRLVVRRTSGPPRATSRPRRSAEGPATGSSGPGGDVSGTGGNSGAGAGV